MKKRIALFLVLALLLSVIPMTTAAATPKTEIKDIKKAFHAQQSDGSFWSTYVLKDGSVVTAYNFVVTSSTNGAYTYGMSITGKGAGVWLPYHSHNFNNFTINRDGHFYRCSCGARGHVIPHIDPKDAVDGRCTCGYKFMTNAQITTLWISGVQLSPRFTKDKYEYTGTLTRDLDEIVKLTVRTFDAKATLEMPEDMTLKKGDNVFKFTVTAEDAKTTQTYTITIKK